MVVYEVSDATIALTSSGGVGSVGIGVPSARRMTWLPSGSVVGVSTGELGVAVTLCPPTVQVSWLPVSVAAKPPSGAANCWGGSSTGATMNPLTSDSPFARPYEMLSGDP